MVVWVSGEEEIGRSQQDIRYGIPERLKSQRHQLHQKRRRRVENLYEGQLGLLFLKLDQKVSILEIIKC